MPFRLLILFAVLATGMVVQPASAATPSFSGCGKFVKDNPGDGVDAPTSNPAPGEGEIEAGWIDAGGGKPSLNLQIANLTGKAPAGATSITYDATYSFTGGTTNFVRAYIDAAGMVTYEYGHTEPLAVSTRYAYDGDTEGEIFPGEHGVIRIVLPADAGGKAGSQLKGITGEVQIGRTAVVPGAVNQSPSRGLSYESDNVGIGAVTIGDCPAGAPAAGGAPTTAPSTPPSSTPTTQAGPAPVALVTKKLKRAKARKAVKVKLKTSEPLTQVAVRLAKGKTVFGTGKLAKLTKTGTVKLKLSKAIKKGSYAFIVEGTDGSGRPRSASLKIRVA